MPFSSSGGRRRLCGRDTFLSFLFNFFSFNLYLQYRYESFALSLGRTSSQTTEWNEKGGKIRSAVLGEEELLIPIVREGKSTAAAKTDDRLSPFLKSDNVYSQDIFLKLPESRGASGVSGSDFFPAGYHHDAEDSVNHLMDSVLRDGTPRHNNPMGRPLVSSLRPTSTLHAPLDRKTLPRRSFMINPSDINKKRPDSHGQVEFTDPRQDRGQGRDATDSMIKDSRREFHKDEDVGDVQSVSLKASFLSFDNKEVFAHDLKPAETTLLSSEEEEEKPHDKHAIPYHGMGVETFSASAKNSLIRRKKGENDEEKETAEEKRSPLSNSGPQPAEVSLYFPSSNPKSFSSSFLSSSVSSHAFVDTSSDLLTDMPFIIDDHPQEIEEDINVATALSRAGPLNDEASPPPSKRPRDRGRRSGHGGGHPRNARRRRSEGDVDAVPQGAAGAFDVRTEGNGEPTKQRSQGQRASRPLSLHSPNDPRQSDSDIFARKADELLQRQEEESGTSPQIGHAGGGKGGSDRSHKRSRVLSRRGNLGGDTKKDLFTESAEELLRIEESGQTYPSPPGLVFPSPSQFMRLNFFVPGEDLSIPTPPPSESTVVVSVVPSEDTGKGQHESLSKETEASQTNSSQESSPPTSHPGESASLEATVPSSPSSSPLSPSPSSPASAPHFESWTTDEIRAYGDQFYDEMSMRLGRYKRAAEASRRRTARTEADEVRGDPYSIYLCQQLRPLNVPSLDTPYLSRLGRMFHRLDQALSRATKAISVTSTKILRWLKKRLQSKDAGKQKQKQPGKATLFLRKLSAYVTVKVKSIATKITALLIRYMPTILFFVQIFLLISASSAVATGPGILAIIALVSSITSLLAFLVSQGTELNQQQFAGDIFSSLSPNVNLQTFGLLWADVRAEQIVHTATTPPMPTDLHAPPTGDSAGRESLEEEEDDHEFFDSSFFSSLRTREAPPHDEDYGDMVDGDGHHSRRTPIQASRRDSSSSSDACEGSSPPYLDEVTAALRAANEIRNARDSPSSEGVLGHGQEEEEKEQKERISSQRGRKLVRRRARRIKNTSSLKADQGKEKGQGMPPSSSPEREEGRRGGDDEVDGGRRRNEGGERGKQEGGRASRPPKTEEQLLRERLEEIRQRMKENLTKVTHKEKMERRKQRIKETWEEKRFKGAGVILLTALRMMFSSVNRGVHLLLRAFGSAWTYVVDIALAKAIRFLRMLKAFQKVARFFQRFQIALKWLFERGRFYYDFLDPYRNFISFLVSKQELVGQLLKGTLVVTSQGGMLFLATLLWTVTKPLWSWYLTRQGMEDAEIARRARDELSENATAYRTFLLGSAALKPTGESLQAPFEFKDISQTQLTEVMFFMTYLETYKIPHLPDSSTLVDMSPLESFNVYGRIRALREFMDRLSEEDRQRFSSVFTAFQTWDSEKSLNNAHAILMRNIQHCALRYGASAFKDEIKKQYYRMQSRGRKVRKKGSWFIALAPQERLVLAEKLHRAIARHASAVSDHLQIRNVISKTLYDITGKVADERLIVWLAALTQHVAVTVMAKEIVLRLYKGDRQVVDPYSLRVSPLPVDQLSTTRELQSTLRRLFSVRHSEDVLRGLIGEISDEEAEDEDLGELERSFLIEMNTDGESSPERSRPRNFLWRRKKRQVGQKGPLICPVIEPIVNIRRDVQEGSITFLEEPPHTEEGEETEETGGESDAEGGGRGDTLSVTSSSSSARSSSSSDSSKPEASLCAKAAARLFMKLQMNSSFMMRVRQEVFGKSPDICASFTSPAVEALDSVLQELPRVEDLPNAGEVAGRLLDSVVQRHTTAAEVYAKFFPILLPQGHHSTLEEIRLFILAMRNLVRIADGRYSVMGALQDALRAKGEQHFRFSEAAGAQVHFLVDFNKVCK
ncbi:transmembrane protein, partial [Cystoisospora suis]